jgi:hypothetical protein
MSTPEEQFKTTLKSYYKEDISTEVNKFWVDAEAKRLKTSEPSIINYLHKQAIGTKIGAFEKINEGRGIDLEADNWNYVGNCNVKEYSKTLDKIDKDKGLFFCMNCNPKCKPDSDHSKKIIKYDPDDNVCKDYCGRKGYTCSKYLLHKQKSHIIQFTNMLFDGISEIPLPGLSGLCGKVNKKINDIIVSKALDNKSNANKWIKEINAFFEDVKKTIKEQTNISGAQREGSAESLSPLLQRNTDLNNDIKKKYNELLDKIMFGRRKIYTPSFTKTIIPKSIIPKSLKRDKKYARFDRKADEEKRKLWTNEQKEAAKAYLILTSWGISTWGTNEDNTYGGGPWVTGDVTTSLTCNQDYKALYEPLYEDEEPEAGEAAANANAGGGGKKKSKKKKTKKKKSRKNKSRKNKKK